MLIVALLAATSPSLDEVYRTRYEDCMLAYAQVEMMGTKSTITIAIQAREVCRREQEQYRQSLIESIPGANEDLLDGFSAAVVRRVIAFTNRYR